MLSERVERACCAAAMTDEADCAALRSETDEAREAAVCSLGYELEV
jgi:hypothetical protein